MSDDSSQADRFEAQIQRVTTRLENRNPAGVPRAVIERTVRECFADFEDARIKEFLGVLAERSVAARMRSADTVGPAGDAGGGAVAYPANAVATQTSSSASRPA